MKLSSRDKHRDLIRRIQKANVGLNTTGFWTGLAEYIAPTIESYEYEGERDPVTGRPSTTQVRSFLQSLAGHCLPAAWQIVLPNEREQTLVIWEIANTQRLDVVVEKWLLLAADVLDVTGDISIAVIICDAEGVCRVSLYETFAGGDESIIKKVLWRADDQCPIDWKEAVHDRPLGNAIMIESGRQPET